MRRIMIWLYIPLGTPCSCWKSCDDQIDCSTHDHLNIFEMVVILLKRLK